MVIDDSLVDEDLLEELLADKIHQIWAEWMRYLFSVTTGEECPKGAVVIPASFVMHWRRQMMTAYDRLPQAERESDLEIAREILKLILADKLDDDK